MKNYRKALLLVLCAVLLVAASVLGTLAYLTDTKSVTNTFTVGSVKITLDENKVDDQGKAVTPADRHDDGNTYHLLPGHEYDKDPIVHVVANSDDCYVFVKVENQIAAIEDQINTVVAQITANNWSKLSGVDNVYYKVSNKTDADRDLEVFAKFKIDGKVTNDILDDYAGKTIVVTAYAIQKDGFTDAKDAWDAGNTEVKNGGWVLETTPAPGGENIDG